ncbi:unnamed protein product [Sphenostylis stenocarpa]|uniref:NB-ARC domain-containing protein n=1 Tax=Sphenostylis stenocarpa TaxID=92480 RepID=A0AA87BCG4_9FABA|nr:unnamed protein product [Sphenostylis stenocarpa]
MSILGLVGPSGIGKSTLARVGYKDDKYLSGKKLLLVLDGCWSVRDWEKLRPCFEFAASGSAIILTTRTTKAALQMLVGHVLHLSFLSMEDCCSTQLEVVGKRILSKCGGVPLAAKMLGGLLHEKDYKVWEEIRRNQQWDEPNIDLAAPFVRLCYLSLPIQLKTCITYLPIGGMMVATSFLINSGGDEDFTMHDIVRDVAGSSELEDPEHIPLKDNVDIANTTHGLDQQSPEFEVKLHITTNDVVQPSFESPTHFDTLRIWDASQLVELPPELHRLRIEGCHTFKSLKHVLMDRSTNLFELFIIDCSFLQYFTDESCPTSLRTLYLLKCGKLDFLLSLEKMQNFKFLEHLFIGFSCNNLKSFPMNLFPKLKILCIWDCPNVESLSIEECQDHDLSLESLEIRDCSNMVSFPLMGLRGLPSCLKLLSIAFCDKLIPQKDWNLQVLHCLQRFEIESGCMGLRSFPMKDLLPVNLKSLYISKFASLEVLDHNGLQQLASLKSLEINCCIKLHSLPEFLPSSLTSYASKNPQCCLRSS